MSILSYEGPGTFEAALAEIIEVWIEDTDLDEMIEALEAELEELQAEKAKTPL
jgi:hypothetical protein